MDSRQASQVTTGLVVVAIGLILLAGQFESGWAQYWPVIFLVLGAGKLMSRDGRGSGVWFLFLGAIFLMHTHRVLSLRESWPLFIVAAGVSMLFPREHRRRRFRHGLRSDENPSGPGVDDGRFHP